MFSTSHVLILTCSEQFWPNHLDLCCGCVFSAVTCVHAGLQLRRAVEAWEPRVETVPLHAWLHPWLPMLSAHLADLYPGIRFKLATALQQWHPSDGSAKELLSPWQPVRARLGRRLQVSCLLRVSCWLPYTHLVRACTGTAVAVAVTQTLSVGLWLTHVGMSSQSLTALITS